MIKDTSILIDFDSALSLSSSFSGENVTFELVECFAEIILPTCSVEQWKIVSGDKLEYQTYSDISCYEIAFNFEQAKRFFHNDVNWEYPPRITNLKMPKNQSVMLLSKKDVKAYLRIGERMVVDIQPEHK